MRFGEMRIPEELKNAQKNNELVIFAGAGVSYAPPARLPKFEQVLEWAWEKYGSQTELRKFSELARPYKIAQLFERLEVNCGGVVRQYVHQTYSKDVEASILHKGLIRLFKPGHFLKIITPNYDRLLTKEAKDHRGIAPHEYIYPELILKSDRKTIGTTATANYGVKAHPVPENQLNGIAYIHGSVKGEAGQLILTDQNFADAYMHNRRTIPDFLNNVVNMGCVMFVGYSLRDPLLPYWIKANRGKINGFTLCIDDQAPAWHSHGVVPVPYPASDAHDKHYELARELCAWADEVQNTDQLSKELLRVYPSVAEQRSCDGQT